MIDKAKHLLSEFKGDSYVFGTNVLDAIGPKVASLGATAVLVVGSSNASLAASEIVKESLGKAGVKITKQIKGSRPNTPREDVDRIIAEMGKALPKVVIGIGGSSNIDATKAATAAAACDVPVHELYGIAKVCGICAAARRKLPPIIAVQTAAAAGSHLVPGARVTQTWPPASITWPISIIPWAITFRPKLYTNGR